MNRRPTALAFALACLLASPVNAQDSFGGAPAPRPEPAPTPPQASQAPQASWSSAPPPAAAPAPATGAASQQDAFERQDLGVAATPRLKEGGLHGPTPNQLPGGRLVTTSELAQLLRDPASGVLVFDVLGGPQRLPNAIPVVPAAQGGSFEDQVQREFGNYLQQVTQGRKDLPMVFYCQSVQCWMSYNAALRATRMGYTRVLWYRGGIEAWQQAGGPLHPAGR